MLGGMEHFTSQELVYLAHAARKCAIQAEESAAKTGGPMRDNEECAVQCYRKLAEKCERMAKVAPRT